MEIELEPEEKSVDSFQAEMDLVKEEEETENRLSQKERKELILAKIKNQISSNEESQENPQVLRANPNILRAAQKKEEISNIPEPFVPNFKLNQRYFYQTINIEEWIEINSFIEKFIDNDLTENDLEEFFEAHPKIPKGNIIQLQNAVEKIFNQKPNLEKYKIITNFLVKKYFKPKPVICECYFFPNPSNEQRVVNMFRTCKKTLDLAIFTFTRDSIAQAILEANQRGVKIRCIGDDGNSKVKGSDVRLLALNGIPCKTDNNLRFHMHNKMAIIDNSVVITGSFNWTSQAVNKNQDNILFIEDKNIATQYTDYYNKMWDSFDTVITQEDAKKYLENEKNKELEKKSEKEKQQAEATKQETIKKETAKKESTKKESTKKETTKKETAKKETTKKETAKKETTKKEPAKKEIKKKETTKKPETKKKESTKKSESKPKTTTVKKSESKSKSKDKKEPSTKKSTTIKKKETETKKKTTEKKEDKKKSKSETKEKKKTTKAKTTTTKPKTVKEQKKEKNEKRKPATTKRVRGVKTNKEKAKKKK
jgi:hypothetical protein